MIRTRSTVLVLLASALVIAALVLFSFGGSRERPGDRSQDPGLATVREPERLAGEVEASRLPVSVPRDVLAGRVLQLKQLGSAEVLQAVACDLVVDGAKTAATTSTEGTVVVPADAKLVALRPHGYFPEHVAAGQTEVTFRKCQVVLGFVVGLESTHSDLVILPSSATPGPMGSAGYAGIALPASHTFEFVPTVWEEHVVALVRATSGSMPEIARAVWAPGQDSVTLRVGEVAPSSPCAVTLDVRVPHTFVEAIQARKQEIAATGGQVAPTFGHLSVRAIDAKGSETRVGSAEILGESVQVVGEVSAEGTYRFQVLNMGLSVSPTTKPFLVRAPASTIAISLELVCEVEVLVRGFETANLLRNPVMVSAKDERGSSVRTEYMKDGIAGSGTVVASHLLPGRVAVWGLAPKLGSRPVIVDLAPGTRPSVVLDLVKSAVVKIDLSRTQAVLNRLMIVDPATGAGMSVRFGKGPLSTVEVATGAWKIVGYTESGEITVDCFAGEEGVVVTFP